jgi:hypothetical protein
VSALQWQFPAIRASQQESSPVQVASPAIVAYCVKCGVCIIVFVLWIHSSYGCNLKRGFGIFYICRFSKRDGAIVLRTEREGRLYQAGVIRSAGGVASDIRILPEEGQMM